MYAAPMPHAADRAVPRPSRKTCAPQPAPVTILTQPAQGAHVVSSACVRGAARCVPTAKDRRGDYGTGNCDHLGEVPAVEKGIEFLKAEGERLIFRRCRHDFTCPNSLRALSVCRSCNAFTPPVALARQCRHHHKRQAGPEPLGPSDRAVAAQPPEETARRACHHEPQPVLSVCPDGNSRASAGLSRGERTRQGRTRSSMA
jgi:hypothetical protein